MQKNNFFSSVPLQKRIKWVFILLFVITGCLTLILILLPVRANHVPEPNNDTKQPENLSISDSTPPHEDNSGTISPQKKGKIAIIIDDVGYNLTRLKRLLLFPGKLTIAVLPQLPLSKECAELVHAAGKEVILHLPMQPEGNEDPGPGLITVDQDKEQIIVMLESDLSTVPYARGVNNHMGSLATADRRVIDIIWQYCLQHNLFFLDSKTTPNSVISSVAGKDLSAVLTRDLFLDNEKNKKSIKDSLLKGMETADNKGSAVLIGHLGDELIDVLNEMYPLFVKQGYKLITASELLENTEGE